MVLGIPHFKKAQYLNIIKDMGPLNQLLGRRSSDGHLLAERIA